MDNEFLTVEEASELMDRTPNMLDIYVKHKKLTKYMRLGRVLFKRSEIEKLLIPKPVNSETQT